MFTAQDLLDINEQTQAIKRTAERERRDLTVTEEAHIEELALRFARIEQALDPGAHASTRTTEPGPIGGAPRGLPQGVTKFYGPRGDPVYAVGSSGSVASVLGGKAPEIDFGRWLAATVVGDRCGDVDALKWAREVQGSVSTGSTGVVIPAQYMGAWIDLLRANSVLIKAGAQTIPMAAKTCTWAALTADATAAWHTEATNDISATDPTFAARTLTAKTLAVRTQISVELAADSPNFGGQLADSFAKAMAVKIDAAGLHGASGGPAGLYGSSGVGTVSGVSTPTDYAEMLSGLKVLLDADNALEDVNKFAIMSPRTWLTYQSLATGITSDKTQLTRPEALRDMQFLVTTSVSNTLDSPADNSTIFLGDFRWMYLGMRQDATIQILQNSAFPTSLLLDVVGYMRADWLVARPASFCTLNAVDD